jgi:two-component system, cell cycle response regulator
VTEERRAVLTVGVPADVAASVAEAGYRAVPLASLDDLEAAGADEPIALLVGTDVRHIGLGELAVPVLVVVGDDPKAIQAAMQRGAHDVVRHPIFAAELAARVRSADRVTRARQALREAARTDELTGLATRRHLDEHLAMAGSMARRLGTPFSVVLIDVDRTRRINDEHGHLSGDEVVTEVARRLAAALRSEDIAGRWGGDEFLVVLPHTPVDGAWRLADRIRGSICDDPIELSAGGDVLATVSVGCAEGHGDDLEGHLRRAGAALVEAKESGRNKVVAGT